MKVIYEKCDDDIISIALVTNNIKYIKILFRGILKLFGEIKYVRIQDDENMLLSYNQKWKSKSKVLYPMKQTGLLFFRLAEFHATIESEEDIDTILTNWGHYQLLDLYLCKKIQMCKLKKVLTQNVYNKKEIFNIFDAFDFVISQSGDENEIEIKCKKDNYTGIQKIVQKIVDSFITD